MTYLAYDPIGLRIFEVRATRALEQLRRLRSDDPDAATAMRTVRRIVHHMDGDMLPTVHRILRADPLREDIDDRDDLPAVQNSLARFMAVERGWAVALDPRADDPTRTTVDEARALGRRLQELSPKDLADDPSRMRWITRELNLIGADPAPAAAFAAEFDRWAEWTSALARPRAMRVAQLDGGMRMGLDDLDMAIAAFAHVAHHQVGAGGTLPWLDTVDPYTAALVVRDLGLTGQALADMVRRLRDRPAEELDDLPGENTGDILLKALLAEPSALAPYLLAAVWHPASIFDHLVDPGLAAEVARRGSDPALVDPDTARRIVVPLLAYFAQDRSLDPGLLLADLIVPWTVYFSPANNRWNLDAAFATKLVNTALRQKGALNRFVEQADAIVAGARRTFATEGAHSIADFTSYLGMIGVLIVNERVRRLDLRERAWQAIFSLASIAASFVPGAVLGTAATLTVVIWSHAGAPDLREQLRDAKRGSDVALAQAGVVVARSVYDRWLQDGRITDQVPPPPQLDLDGPNIPSVQFLNAFIDWLMLLPGADTGELGLEMRGQVAQVLNGWTVGEHVVYNL